MCNFPSTSDERIELGIQGLRATNSLRAPEEFLKAALRRRNLMVLRTRLSAGLSAAVSLGAVGYLLMPQTAMASLATVVKQSDQAGEYMSITHSWNLMKGSDEMVGDVVTWRRGNLYVKRSANRTCPHELNANKSLADAPLDQSTIWMEKSGRYVVSNNRCEKAVSFRGLPFTFPTADKIGDWLKFGQLVSSNAGVSAHGGVFDRYIIRTPGSPGETTTNIVYADPKTHRVRFFDIPKHANHEMVPTADPSTNQWVMAPGPGYDWIELSTEYRYPDQAGLWQNPPPEPDNSESSDAVRARFLSEIGQPVADQTVGGIKKTLFGIVIESGGEVVAITTGGAPREEADPHELQIVHQTTWVKHTKAPSVGKVQPLGQRNVIFPVTIGSREYIAEESRVGLLAGQNPKSLTIRVPVWRYDRRRPLSNYPGVKPSVLYPSLFVGYATFTTSKIYEMPGGFGNANSGEKLPSYY